MICSPELPCTMVAFTKEEKVEIIREVFFQFTTQRSPLLLQTLVESLFSDNDDILDTPFCRMHPNGQFVYKAFYQVFYLFTFTAMAMGNLSKKELIKETCNEIQKRLERALAEITYNINIGYVNALCAETYESKTASKMAITIVPSSCLSILDKADAVRFSESGCEEFMTSRIRAIRKQLNLGIASTLVVGCHEGCFLTQGIAAPEDKESYPHFEFDGNHSWSFYIPYDKKTKRKQKRTGSTSQCILRYCKSTLMFPVLDMLPEIQNLISKQLECESSIPSEKTADYIKTTSRMVAWANDCKHGAVLIISTPDAIKLEVSRLVEGGKRGIPLEKPVYLASAEILQRLSEVDGAMLVDFSGNCHACGVILDGYLEKNDKSGDRSRGSRFNSSQQYILQCKKLAFPLTFGVVKSEDGMLDLLCSCDEIDNFPDFFC